MIAALLEFMMPLATLLYALLFQFHADVSFNQDMGRHLKLGELIIRNGHLPFTNLFTYTNPDFSFVNHHWFSEIVYYFAHLHFGTGGLLAIKLACMLSVVLIPWLVLGRKKENIILFCIGVILYVPLFLDRPDTRPEQFGYVFFAIMLAVVLYKRSIKLLYLLPVLMLLWVNMHITFVFGYVLLGVTFLTYGKKSIPFIIAALLATCFNPRGLYGAIFPLLIFKDYGYAISENQSLLFLLEQQTNFHYQYFLFLTPATVLMVIGLARARKYAIALAVCLFYGLSWYQVRHMPFFTIVALFCVPFIAQIYIPNLLTKSVSALQRFGVAIFFILFFGFSFFYISIYGLLVEQNKTLTFTYAEDYKKVTDFVLQNHLPRKIFNNFDNGGYLDYRLYPQYKTFVDNRPDAFPGKFFREIYIPAQNDEAVWKSVIKQFDIKTIVFAHTDQTPWAEAFIRRIAEDSTWKMVYLDASSVVWVRDNKYKDIRTNNLPKFYLIPHENNYRNLLYLARFYQMVGYNWLTDEAIKKAATLSPASCSVVHISYTQLLGKQSPYFTSQAEQLRNTAWYCF